MDKQAAARVWRDGQTKRCFVYRFLTTGSIEEKVYQRQLSKEGLSGVLGGSTADASLSKEELRDLFNYDDNAFEQPSDTHKSLDCECMDPYQITTEEEALKAELAGKKEAEEQIRHVEEAARKAKEASLLETASEEGQTLNGCSGSSNKTPADDEPATFTMDGDGDTKMSTGDDDSGLEPGAPMEGVKEGGEGEGAEGAAESSGDEDGDEEMNDFIEKDDGEGSAGGSDSDDYGSKKKGSKSKAKKPNKKDGPRKQRKKRTAIGSLNFPQLHALSSATLGQRGEPPEEELINWAHHATSNSIPDPIFRVAAKSLPFTRGQLPFVSFVFSCEVSGKAILNSSDATDAMKVTSRCEAAPTTVQASKPKEVSLELARANHAQFMERERDRQRRKLGNDDVTMEERLADPSKRRHSSRNAGKTTAKEMPEDEEDDDDRAFVVKDGDEDGEGEEGEEGEKKSPAESRKRKSTSTLPAAVAADMDEASRIAIEEMLKGDMPAELRGKSRGRPKKSTPTNDTQQATTKKDSPAKGAKSTKNADEEEESDDAMEDVVAGATGDDDVVDGSKSEGSSVQLVSPPSKKQKTAADTDAVAGPMEVDDEPPEVDSRSSTPPPATSPVKKQKPELSTAKKSNLTVASPSLPKKNTSSSSPAAKKSKIAAPLRKVVVEEEDGDSEVEVIEGPPHKSSTKPAPLKPMMNTTKYPSPAKAKTPAAKLPMPQHQQGEDGDAMDEDDFELSDKE